ncbi:Hypothetical_protein [Hexamita inflata]|uniref:Hypothetical_protein n=1 Tax=Hexamita inflata TaxID=28002 RepID=A0AA86NSC2_9EUKA|nr:Hypothetical protein HINF_LOCUS12038 [Hexamita inflata]
MDPGNISMLGWLRRQRRGFPTKTPGFKSGRGQISLYLFSSQRGPWAQYLCTYIHVYARQMPRRPALETQGSARRSLTTRGSSTDNNTRKAGEPSTRRALQADQSSQQSDNMSSNHRPGSLLINNLYSRQHPNGRQNSTKVKEKSHQVTPNRSWRNYFATFPTRSYFMQPPRELRLQFSTRSYACPRIWRKIYLKFDFDSLRAARREWSWGKPASAHSTHIFAPLPYIFYQFLNCKGSQK